MLICVSDKARLEVSIDGGGWKSMGEYVVMKCAYAGRQPYPKLEWYGPDKKRISSVSGR